MAEALKTEIKMFTLKFMLGYQFNSMILFDKHSNAKKEYSLVGLFPRILYEQLFNLCEPTVAKLSRSSPGR